MPTIGSTLVTDLLASPAFTGIPTAPTAAEGTNTDQIATTEFVLANSGDTYSLAMPMSDYTILLTDNVILSNGVGVTLTLPSAVEVLSGRIFRIKNINSSPVTVLSSVGTIDGILSKSVSKNQAITCISDGSNWFII